MPALSRSPRLLLVSVNREKMPYPVFPLGVAYVSGAARQAGAEVSVLDLCFSEDPLGDLRRRVADAQPDLVGVSIRNLDTATYPRPSSSLPYLRALTGALRESGTPVLLGGSGFSVAPEAMLQALDLSLGVQGEGEAAIAEIVSALRDGSGFENVPGLVRRTDGEFFRNPAPLRPFVGSAAPDRSLLDNARYWIEGGMANVQTKRGCSYRCMYCSYPVLEGRTMRLRTAEEVVDEVESIVRNLAIDYVFFVDSIFNVPATFAASICEEILRRGLKLRWSCYLTPAEATPELVDLMARAGCREMEWGADSGSDAQLRNLRKSFGADQIRRVATACRERGIAFSCDLILGGPGETESTLSETFALMDEIAPTAVICMVGVRLYPGTEAERRARETKEIPADASLLEPTFSFAGPGLPAERTLERVIEKASADPRWIVPGIGANISPELLQRLRRSGRMGPLWELTSKNARPRVPSVEEVRAMQVGPGESLGGGG